MAQAAHQRIHGRTASGLRGILFQPFPKGCIQSLVLRSSYQPRLLNKVFVSAQSDIFHTYTVYTIFVHLRSDLRLHHFRQALGRD